MSIYDLSDELIKRNWGGKRNRLLNDLRESIQDAHRSYKELDDFGVSQEIEAVIRLYIEYVIQKGNVTPKDKTIAGIMGIGRALRAIDLREISEEDYERAHANYDKKIDEGRKILSVLRRYEAVSRNLYFMSLSGARIESVYNQLLIDGVDYVSI